MHIKIKAILESTMYHFLCQMHIISKINHQILYILPSSHYIFSYNSLFSSKFSKWTNKCTIVVKWNNLKTQIYYKQAQTSYVSIKNLISQKFLLKYILTTWCSHKFFWGKINTLNIISNMKWNQIQTMTRKWSKLGQN